MFASAQKLPKEQLEEDEYDMNKWPNEEKKMNENENECEVFNNNEDDNLTMMSEDFQ